MAQILTKPSTWFGIACSCILLLSCERDGVEADRGSDLGEGRLRVELTDAAIDDPNVATAYVTLTGIGLNGLATTQFDGRKTIDISNYSQGRSIQVGNDQIVTAGQYQGLTLTFDTEFSENGQSLGCYVETTDGVEHPLGFGQRSVSVDIAGAFEVRPLLVTELVVDLDLRKAIQYSEDGYSMVSAQRLARSLRVVDRNRSGSIDGRISNHTQTRDDGGARIVYAYPKASLNLEAEASNDYEGALTSADVNAAGNFRLSYLPAGSYELIVVDYADKDGDQRLEVLGPRISDLAVRAATRVVVVSSGAKVSVELEVGAML